jgi:hypothetical protein
MEQSARTRASRRHSVSPPAARRLILDLPGVEVGRSYGLPAFKVAGKFLARFRDDDEVLVIRVSAIEDRDVLMRLAPKAFFFTDHYRDYPAVLVRLAEVERSLLEKVLQDAWRHATALTKRLPQRGRKAGRRVMRRELP